ncbi:hypothetical protein E8E13_011127 [Curvularia kusanoi]|uniref:RNase III domain-containing protein n=1 Tax=Curvularia kusanoi TaxID=90978 RepID=A0A9P4TK47_CURKU|nr:hypothetical protein E8E13_011127 [Curvularia kusanoi]
MSPNSIDVALLIQTNLHYAFVNEQLLHSALRSAHREKDADGVHDDGNRGLAHYGNLAIQMVMAYEAVIDKGMTLYDLHTHDHWSKTKKSRAKACKVLGIEPLIIKSVRQQHQSPSDTVLDHALSAVLGAIWLDCERQEQKLSDIRSTILRVLRTIDAIVDEQSVTADCVPGVEETPAHKCNSITDLPGGQSATTGLNQGGLDDVEYFIREWFEKELGHLPLEMLTHQNSPLALQAFSGQDDCITFLNSRHMDDINVSNPAPVVDYSAFEGADVGPRADGLGYETQDDEPSDTQTAQTGQSQLVTSQNIPSDAAKAMKGAKRKRDQGGEENFNSLYQKMLQAEQRKLACVSQVEQESLNRFLRHPALEKLEGKASILAQFLYLAIGSWRTIVDFKDLLQLARSDSTVCRQPSLLRCNAAVMYGEICRLEKEEALCVLLRRYHIINLCDEEQLYNDCHSHIIVETPITVGGLRVAKPGNPVFALDSSLTERLLSKIMPSTDPESGEFKKARSKVKRLRRLAERLHILVKRYGFGVLGLLPSGSSFEQMSLTDNMLLSMTQASFDDFAQLLHQEQGQHLESLSRFIEPSLLALVEGFPNSDVTFLTEGVDIPLLSNLPKGLMWRNLPPLRFHA